MKNPSITNGKAGPRRRGFTLIELLVVIAIILLLMTILLPSVDSTRTQAQRVLCLANQRNVTTGWILYSTTFQGLLVNSYTSNGYWADSGTITNAWVWYNENSIRSIQDGSLYPFINDMRVYKCPSQRLAYYRSYSINAKLNGEQGWGRRFGQIRFPSRTFVLVEESDLRGFLINSFMVQSGVWIDQMAFNHRDGDNFSFADGHAEYWKYTDPRTKTVTGYFTPQSGNPDLERIAAASWPTNGP